MAQCGNLVPNTNALPGAPVKPAAHPFLFWKGWEQPKPEHLTLRAFEKGECD